MKIGITDCGEKYPIYEKWILSQRLNAHSIEIIKLGYKLNNLDKIKECDGIVLTGGEDIHPKYYAKTADQISAYLRLCNPDFMDERRDEFEWQVCEYIFENKIPILGICRGLQLVNVFLGGTLIPDIQTAGKESHSKYFEGKDRYHSVEILDDSELSKITNIVFGDINSAHHQSADIIANSLKINALSEDKIVEGLEWRFDFAHRSHYLMLVQWHPERIINAEENAFSSNLRQDFIENVQLKIK
jgi:putative glutamine amidotransferase